MPARPDWAPTRVLSWLYCAPARRGAVAALYGIEQEIAHSLRPGLDHDVAHTRLAWWQQECERCARGEPTHPLTRTLHSALAPDAHLALARLDGLVGVAAWDLSAATFEDESELGGYCERWSAALMTPLAHLLRSNGAAAPLGLLGAALKQLELLCNLAPDARRGRLRLPLSALAAAQVAPERLAAGAPWPESLAQLLQVRHRQQRLALAAAVGALGGGAQRALRPLMVWSALAAGRSRRAQRALPGERASGDHHAPLDGYRAWRAAQQADVGRFRVPVE